MIDRILNGEKPDFILGAMRGAVPWEEDKRLSDADRWKILIAALRAMAMHPYEGDGK